ncbi:MAG: recombinase family protein [Candidatus Dormibacteria bacterium]
MCRQRCRLHRNDLEFFKFMAEMTERQILVFDGNGLISNADKLSWKIKAVVAQEEREKIARRVRDNLRYLKRQGALLGILPQGYRRVDGRVVEDPEVAAVVRSIFAAYATGQYSFNTLADHLNRQGIKPCRGPQKENHNRKRALIFTGDVLKDMLKNPSYIGQVEADGQLIEGQHPALIDEQTWAACVDVRANNRRRTSKTWTRHSYPLTLLLYCAQCGAPMHGEASVDRDGSNRLYYACHARRRRRATDPSVIRCTAPFIRTEVIEQAIREELGRIAPQADLHEAYRAGLRRSLPTKPRAQRVTETAIKRLADQLSRIARLYEFGEYDWEAFVVKRSEIREEQKRLKTEAESHTEDGDVEWCETQILDLIAAWDAGDDGQRSRLLAGLFDRIEAERMPGGALKVVAVPRAGWARFFGAVALERETRLELATSSLEG